MNYFIDENYRINNDVAHHIDINFSEEGQREVYVFAKKIMLENNFKTVLDVGCGSGYKLIKYLGDFETTGIETEPCFSDLKNRYPDRNWLLSGNPEKDFVDYNINPDLIICSDVIEHISDPDNLLNYLFKFNPKYYIISTPCREVLCKNPKFSGEYGKSWNGPPLNPCHVREWTQKEFIRYLKTKFEVLGSHYGTEQIECQYHLLRKGEINLCFYSCFYGNDDNPSFKIPQIDINKYNHYFYTNNTKMLELLKDTEWIPIFDNKQGENSCMLAKDVKVNSTNFKDLNIYNYTCFLDSKLEKLSTKTIEKLIKEYLIEEKDKNINRNIAMILRKHWFLGPNIWEEFNESMKQERYLIDKDKYESYINSQLQSGLQENVESQSACGLIIRNMNHEKLKDIERDWYENILKCGIQDQISFFFVKQRFQTYIQNFTDIPFL